MKCFGNEDPLERSLGRSSGCELNPVREIRRSSGPLAARAELLSVEDPLVREKFPRERLRRRVLGRRLHRSSGALAARAARVLGDLELRSDWAFSLGLNFYPRFLFIFIIFY